MLALCFVGVFVFIVRYLFSNKYGILYLLVECMKLPTIQQIRLYNKCWGDTTTVSLPTLFFCKKISI